MTRPVHGASGHGGGLAAILHHEDSTSLRVEDHGDTLQLSFLDENEQAPEARLSPYFHRLTIPRDAWLAQALVALGEYARIVRRTAGTRVPSTGPGRVLDAWSRLALAGLVTDRLDQSRTHS